jgi:hypothetical protein
MAAKPRKNSLKGEGQKRKGQELGLEVVEREDGEGREDSPMNAMASGKNWDKFWLQWSEMGICL